MLENKSAKVTQNAFGCLAKYAVRMAATSFSETYMIVKNKDVKSLQSAIET